ncbi:hypothetical protein, partial [Sutterella wadsworthensis]|uniref:hypothetical protein n=1 Tax=Sutterella wadsworthensis TaxID=40545 RepID=UPI003AAACA7F
MSAAQRFFNSIRDHAAHPLHSRIQVTSFMPNELSDEPLALDMLKLFGNDRNALNYGLPALHFESPRWFRKLEQFKTAPTRGRNTVPDPSVGVVSFMSP